MEKSARTDMVFIRYKPFTGIEKGDSVTNIKTIQKDELDSSQYDDNHGNQIMHQSQSYLIIDSTDSRHQQSMTDLTTVNSTCTMTNNEIEKRAESNEKEVKSSNHTTMQDCNIPCLTTKEKKLFGLSSPDYDQYNRVNHIARIEHRNRKVNVINNDRKRRGIIKQVKPVKPHDDVESYFGMKPNKMYYIVVPNRARSAHSHKVKIYPRKKGKRSKLAEKEQGDLPIQPCDPLIIVYFKHTRKGIILGIIELPCEICAQMTFPSSTQPANCPSSHSNCHSSQPANCPLVPFSDNCPSPVSDHPLVPQTSVYTDIIPSISNSTDNIILQQQQSNTMDCIKGSMFIVISIIIIKYMYDCIII